MTRPSDAVAEPTRRTARVGAVDRLRGLVIVIMALDHSRAFLSEYPYAPTDLSQASALLFLTRWVTHFCAPVFVFLAGTSAWLYARNAGLDRGALQRFLVTRGLWLVALDMTWTSVMWRFDVDVVQVQVLWALGWSMVVLAAALWLPRAAIVLAGLVIVGGHNLLDGVSARDLGPEGSPGALLWIVLHEPHAGMLADGLAYVLIYPLLPMMLGYGFGQILCGERPRRDRLMVALGAAMVALWLILCLSNTYGEPQLWGENPRGALYTALEVGNLTKYPPSLEFLLMTLGPALMVLPWLADRRGRIADFFAVFGRVDHCAAVAATPHDLGGGAGGADEPARPTATPTSRAMARALRRPARPSPKGLPAGARASAARTPFATATIRAGSVPTSVAHPPSTASVRSVTSRSTSTGTPKLGASSWMPPESDRTSAARASSRHICG